MVSKTKEKNGEEPIVGGKKEAISDFHYGCVGIYHRLLQITNVSKTIC